MARHVRTMTLLLQCRNAKGGSMARETMKSSRLARMRGAVARTARKLTSKFHRGKSEEAMQTQASLKGPCRTDGSDRHSDQELANGYVDERWNDEDRFTNKSGDPRIGTHGRSYEPGEHRTRRNR